jgi:hypothetical protein
MPGAQPPVKAPSFARTRVRGHTTRASGYLCVARRTVVQLPERGHVPGAAP